MTPGHMTPRERVFRALDFQPPDRPPVEYHPSPAGLHEHACALRDLMIEYGQDFGDPRCFPMPAPLPGEISEDGRFYKRYTDVWGAEWEATMFGIAGHPYKRPLDDWGNWAAWSPPAGPDLSEATIAPHRIAADAHRARYFLKGGWINIFEAMHSVRRFEDVLMDLAMDEPEINRLADSIVGYQAKQVAWQLALGADAIQFADDFGTQSGLLVSPAVWRRFFRPRYRELIQPVKQAGTRVFFHSCGMVRDLLDDLAELGVDAIWPQVALFNARQLAQRCRSLGMAVAIHPDRSHLMTTGRPEQVRESVLRLADEFQIGQGGSWFYVEIDNGFPFANVKALIETIAQLRGSQPAQSQGAQQ